MSTPSGSVVAVHRSAEHTFSKTPQESITLVAGLGVNGDAHQGARVKHRSRVERDPSQPNLRQVHLVASELLDEVNAKGYDVTPGALGENVTTSGLDLIRLPVGTTLRIGDALLSLTGLRNPCPQIRSLGDGLQKEMIERAADGTTLLKTGVMAVVVLGGDVHPGDAITLALPPGDPIPMQRV